MLTKFKEEGWSLIPGAFDTESRLKAIECLYTEAEREGTQANLGTEFESERLAGHRVVRKLRRLLWNDIPFWSSIFEHSSVFDLGRNFIKGEPAVVFHAAFMKPRLVGSAVGFHQDQALWEKTYPNAVNLWIALTDCNSQNGCLRLYPGSHHYGLLPHTEDPEHPWHPTVSKDTLSVFGMHTPCEVPMAAGDIIVWDRYLVHGSGPNISSKDRLGTVLVFVDAAAENFQAKDIYKLPPKQR